MQQLLEFLKFADGPSFRKLTIGTGMLFLTSYPIELSEGTSTTASVYQSVVESIGMQLPFTSNQQLTPGILIFPVELEDSVLYIIEAEFGEEQTSGTLQLKDSATGAEIDLVLRGQRAALVLIDKKTKQIVAKYGGF